jgi:GxxExxY protein
MINQRGEARPGDDMLFRRVVGLAMKIHRSLGGGFHESFYANALSIELQEAGIPFEREKRFSIKYKESEIGSFYADFLIEARMMVELKASELLDAAQAVHLFNHLSATKADLGLMLNFGAKSLEFKTKTRIRPFDAIVPLLQS